MDTFETNQAGLESPIEHGAAVVPADETALNTVTRALWVGGAGNVAVTMLGGSDVVFAGVPAGPLLPIRVSHVLSTGTTATAMVALW